MATNDGTILSTESHAASAAQQASAAVTAEATRAQAAESTLTANLNSLAQTYTREHRTLANRVSAEVSRATTAETSLAQRMTAVEARCDDTFVAAQQAETDAGVAKAKANAAVLVTEQDLTDSQKSQARENIGLGNVDNTADSDKPVSTAQRSAIDRKANFYFDGVTGHCDDGGFTYSIYNGAGASAHVKIEEDDGTIVVDAVIRAPYTISSEYMFAVAAPNYRIIYQDTAGESRNIAIPMASVAGTTGFGGVNAVEDSAKLGGVPAANYAKQTDIPTVDTTLNPSSTNPLANSAVAASLPYKTSTSAPPFGYDEDLGYYGYKVKPRCVDYLADTDENVALQDGFSTIIFDIGGDSSYTSQCKDAMIILDLRLVNEVPPLYFVAVENGSPMPTYYYEDSVTTLELNKIYIATLTILPLGLRGWCLAVKVVEAPNVQQEA